ncbi:unnamed protein product [Rotaria sordida]|uniref:Uncharacterized protein n=1 Tax=Rotaria sordida TaxID=392033 RepID=A0A815VBZ2_9BILA|nr:unnamed protein product [Rotaria sordida]CAF1663630.1 unnamed protein product [Rotaria sordida]
MTSHSVCNLNNDDEHRLQASNEHVNSNKKNDGNNAITPRSSSTSNLHFINSSLLSVRRPLSADESDDAFPLNNGKECHVNPIVLNFDDMELDQNQVHSINDNQHHLSSYNFVITNESTRFAQIRYPFPLFVLRFGSGKVTSNQVKENLIDHCKKIHRFDVHVLNCRSSSNVLSANEYDILIYVKDAVSFSCLLEQAHWPKVIGNNNNYFPSALAIPPQLCLLIKNVDLRIDFDEFCNDIKTNHPHIKETCRTCGEQVDDMKNHICSKTEKCIHCGQNHKSSSLKCPVVKFFHTELTRKILQLNNHSTPDTNLMNKNIIFNSTNFPPGPPPKSSTLSINPMMVKPDELINKLSEVKNHLTNLEANHDKFEQFILEKNCNDEIVTKKINDISNNHMDLKKNGVQQSLYIDRHENLFCKLLISMFEDLFSFIVAQNCDKRGNPLDADLKCKLNRYLVQMKKAIEGKQFTS